MKLDIKAKELFYAVLYQGIAFPVQGVGDDELAKLRAPIANMVDPHYVVAKLGIDARQAVPDDGGAQVPDTKRLGDIRGRKIDDDLFVLPYFGIAVVDAFPR